MRAVLVLLAIAVAGADALVADFSILEIPSPEDTVVVGREVVPSVLVYADSDNETDSVNIELRIGTSYVESDSIEVLPGDTSEVTFPSWIAESADSYAVRCTLVVDDDTTENNLLDKTVWAVRPRNFSILALLVPPDTVRVGTESAPQVLVRAGADNDTAESVAVVLHIGGYSDETFTLISPGDSEALAFIEWQAEDTGTFHVACTLLVTDDSLGDNVLYDSIRVLAESVDFVLDTIVAPGDTVDSGEVVRPQVVVGSNRGDADDLPVQLLIDDSLYGVEYVPLLETGSIDSLVFDDWEPSSVGNAKLRFVIDYEDSVPGNDTLTRTVYVKPNRLDFAVEAILAPEDTVPYGEDATPAAVVRLLVSTSGETESAAVVMEIAPGYCDTQEVGLDSGDCDTCCFEAWPARPLGRRVVMCRILRPDDNPANDSLVDTTYSFLQQGWGEVSEVPEGPRERGVKAGGWLCYDSAANSVFCAKGNSTNEFYSYDPDEDEWVEDLDSFPKLSSCKVVRAGAAGACDDSCRYVYANKGSSYDFWRYEIATDTWLRLADSVPAGVDAKRPKAGTDMVWVTKSGHGYAYLLKGGTREFYRYDPQFSVWQEKPAAPLGPSGQVKYRAGSFLVYDGDHTIYCNKGRYNEMFKYNILSDSWSPTTLPGMPIRSYTGRRRVTGTGACGVWLGGSIYAFKGNNTQELWRYRADSASWAELETIPREGDAGWEKRVKDGADLVATKDGMLYALKGNKSGDFWCYVPGAVGVPADSNPPGGGGVGEDTIIAGHDVSDPRWNRDGMLMAYTRAADSGAGSGYEQVFTWGGENEDQVTDISGDCATPVFSFEGDKLAFIFEDSATGCGQVATTPLYGDSAKVVRQLTSSAADHRHCEWFKSGELIVYEVDDSSSNRSQLWYVDTVTSTEKPLTIDDADHYWPSYAPDDRIVFQWSRDGDWDQIAIVPFATGEIKPLTDDPTDHERPRVSDDGSSVVCVVVDENGTYQIEKLPLDGDGVVAVRTSGNADMESPCWSPDNVSIYCTRWTGLISAICWVDAATGNYAAITDGGCIREKPDVWYDSVNAANYVIYEREVIGQPGLDQQRLAGTGVFRVKHKPEAAGISDLTFLPLKLEYARPNPATERVRIRWQVPTAQLVSLKVYNTAGRVARVLHQGLTKPGVYTTVWDGTDAKGRRLAAGVYFYALEADGKRLSRKVVLAER